MNHSDLTEKERPVLIESDSQKGLQIGLFRESLEELSFLYEQKTDLFHDDEIIWTELDQFIGKRFDAYLNLLLRGRNLAQQLCRQQATDGDFGELFASVCVFCRQNRQDLVEQTLEEFDFEDEERVKALKDALCHELPDHWQESLIPLLFEKPETIPIAADVIAFRRLPFETQLIGALTGFPDDKTILIPVIHALGRLRSKEAVPVIDTFLSNKDPEIVQAAASMLIRSGSKQEAQRVPKENWNGIDRGFSGGKAELASVPIDSDEMALAAGLIGNIESIPALTAALSKEETAENAALSLNLITGAEIYEEVFIPEEIDLDMLFEDELEKYEKGELYAPGEEPGETITRLSQNPEEWQQWWDENQQNFDPELRYRNGKSYSPECLIENLKSEKSPNSIRKLAYEELVIRYNIDVPFETEMLVKDQIKAIAEMETRVNELAGEFEPGKWYYNGKRLNIQ